MQTLEDITGMIAGWAWGPWLLVLLIGGGLYFLIRSRFLPFKHLGHAVNVLRGRFDDPDAPGHISHARALSAALAGTIGMGNIAGVALAISIGGPGAIFWMWLTAIVGMATKFFTCTLAVMYRGKDEHGQIQGGPMYVITQALPKRWHFLAALFAAAGMIGALPALQSNQLVQIIRDLVILDGQWVAADTDPLWINVVCGGLLAIATAVVVLGGIRRVSQVALTLVPTMSVLYIGAALLALLLHADQVLPALRLIVTDAFTGSAAAGGSLLAVILYGVRRGAYSNEAGIGTEALAHGAARTQEPVREGLVAMIGPIIDTLLVCTATALMILISGVWLNSQSEGVTLTANAFAALLGSGGTVVVFLCIVCFALTTLFTYAYYGRQCAGFLWGSTGQRIYQWVFVAFVLISAVITVEAAINIIDTAFALMAIPTMVSALWLAPRVMRAADQYFTELAQTNR